MNDSEEIRFKAEFIINEGKLEEYKKLINEMGEAVKANEPDTLEYQFYLNKDETKCVVHETFANSAAALAHNESNASKTILPRIFNIARLSRLEVYGNPNYHLRNVLMGFDSQIFSPFTGFTRKQ